MLACCANVLAAVGAARSEDHTCTAPVDRPPDTVRLTVCAAVAVVVSMIVE
jgi:hypothetical protein